MFCFIVLLFGMISMHFEWPLIMNWLVTLSWFSSYGNLRDTTTVLCNLNNLGKRLIKVYMKTLLQMGEPHRHWNNLSIQLSIYQYTSLRRENLKKKKTDNLQVRHHKQWLKILTSARLAMETIIKFKFHDSDFLLLPANVASLF